MADSSPSGQETCSNVATTTEPKERTGSIVYPAKARIKLVERFRSPAALASPQVSHPTPSVNCTDTRPSQQRLNGTGFARHNSVITTLHAGTRDRGRSSRKVFPPVAVGLACPAAAVFTSYREGPGRCFIHDRLRRSGGAGGPKWCREIDVTSRARHADSSDARPGCSRRG